MLVYTALQLLQVEHSAVPRQQFVITEADGKPNSYLTELLQDCLSKIDIFVNLSDTHSVSDIINELTRLTPLPDDVLDEYHKILTQPISSVNVAFHKQVIELVIDRNN